MPSVLRNYCIDVVLSLTLLTLKVACCDLTPSATNSGCTEVLPAQTTEPSVTDDTILTALYQHPQSTSGSLSPYVSPSDLESSGSVQDSFTYVTSFLEVNTHPVNTELRIDIESSHQPVINFTTDIEEFWNSVSKAYFEVCDRACTQRSQDINAQGKCLDCFCDDACFVYRDCCPDKYVTAYNETTYSSQPAVKILCSKTSFGSSREFHFLMVSECPDNETSSALVSQCLNVSSSHWNFSRPVTDTSTLVTYKNVYCARCHGTMDTVPWLMQIIIDNVSSVKGLTSQVDIYQSAMRDGGGEVIYSPPTDLVTHARRCLAAVSNCHESENSDLNDPMVEQACHAFSAPIYLDGTYYKNPFCALCSSRYSWTDILRENRNAPPDTLQGAILVLLEFKPSLFEIIQETGSQCSTNQFWDSHEGKCRNLVCAEGKYRTSSDEVTCHNVFETMELYGYKFCLQTSVSAPHFEDLKDYRIKENLARSLDSLLGNAKLLLTSFEIYDTFMSPVSTATDEKLFLIIVKYVSPFQSKPDDTDQTLLSNLPAYLEEFQKLFSLKSIAISLTCSLKTLYNISKYDDSEIESTSPKYAAYAEQFENMYGLQMEQHTVKYFPVTQQLLCPAVQLESGEWTFEVKTGRVTVLNTGQSVTAPFVYLPDPDTVLVCLEKYQLQSTTQQDTVLWVVSLTAVIISLIFLVISFVIYCLLLELRSIPGTNNMTLIFFLFWAQVTLEIGVDVTMTDWLCQAVGVATHFLWLCVMFAQNVCTFHMFYTLSFPLESHAATLSPGVMIRKYILYVVVFSTAIVAVTVIWQMAMHGDSGYGGETCYLKRVVVRVVMFALPLALTVILNLSLFVVTIVRLRSLQVVSSTRSNKINLLLYTKLSIVTGVTWLSGFLASAIGWYPLYYVFVILQGCQGLFVFLAFLANKRVLGLLQEMTGTYRRKKGSENGFNLTHQQTSPTATSNVISVKL